MGTLLSEELQKYYTRKGNRFVFSNGMTLNQLALEMWEKLGYEGVDSSVLSRVLQGKRLFTLRQLSTFVNILNLPRLERERLGELLYLTLSERLGTNVYISSLETKFFSEFINRDINKISEILIKGLPDLALDWVNNLNSQIREKISLAKEEKDRNLLFEQLSKVTTTKNDVLSHLEETDSFYRSTLMVSRELETIASRIKNREVYGLSRSRLASALYIKGDYLESTKTALAGLKAGIPKELVGYRMLPLRESMISFSKIGNLGEYKKVKSKVDEAIHEYDWHLRFQVYEGIARAEANLRNYASSYKALELAYYALTKDYGTMKAVQAAACELELAKLSKAKISKQYLEKVGKLGLRIAQKHGYKRHSIKIGGYMGEILN